MPAAAITPTAAGIMILVGGRELVLYTARTCASRT